MSEMAILAGTSQEEDMTPIGPAAQNERTNEHYDTVQRSALSIVGPRAPCARVQVCAPRGQKLSTETLTSSSRIVRPSRYFVGKTYTVRT